ncbi:MAG TPA: phasin family protein [Stellaceae bacterium]|jgi:hypothetical protein|nr:phasin family protein [Stellaceae bacterium]
MSDQAKPATWPFALPSLADAMQRQMDTWVKEQSALLDETQKTLARWTKRRQEAMEATSRTFQAILGCKDAGGLPAVYNDWLTGSIDRLVADMHDARDETLRLAEFGQKSMAALMQQCEAAASPIAPPSAATEAPRAKAELRGQAAE